MLISDKYRRPWSDAAHHARPLIRAYDICSAIRSFFVDDVTYVKYDNDMSVGQSHKGRKVLTQGISMPNKLYAQRLESYQDPNYCKVINCLQSSPLVGKELTLRPPSTTIVPYANNLDPDEKLSNSASHPDPSCLTLRQRFHKLWATLKHFENWGRREM